VVIGSARSTSAITSDPGRPPAEPLARGGVDLDDGDLPTRLDAFKVEALDDPVVGKAESEARVFVERDHPALLLM
jgi:hypothetical protein